MHRDAEGEHRNGPLRAYWSHDLHRLSRLAKPWKTGSSNAGTNRATVMTALFGDTAASALAPADRSSVPTKSVFRS